MTYTTKLYLLIIVDLESIVENMWRNFFAEPLSGREQIFFLNQILTITSWKHVIVPRGLWINNSENLYFQDVVVKFW
jgi:hypothetical protein